jgi:hypothetical protein
MRERNVFCDALFEKGPLRSSLHYLMFLQSVFGMKSLAFLGYIQSLRVKVSPPPQSGQV